MVVNVKTGECELLNKNPPIIFPYEMDNFQKHAANSIDEGNLVLVTAHTSADELVIESSGNTGISILTPASSNGAIYFGDPQDNGAGYIDYNHGNNVMSFGAAGPEKLRIQSGGGISFNGDTAAANALNDYEEGEATITMYSNSNVSV